MIFVLGAQNFAIEAEATLAIGDGLVINNLKNVKTIQGFLILRIELFNNVLRNELQYAVDNYAKAAEKHKNYIRNDSDSYKIFDIFTCSHLGQDWHEIVKGRSRRSPFDFGGDILHSLFGVSTVKNLEELKNDLNGKLEIHTIQIEEIVKTSIACV